MQNLILSLTEQEKLKVGDELARLFALQDLAFGKEKKAIFVDEISVLGLPYEAIIHGIRSLVMEDLRSIKLHLLTTAIREFIQQMPQSNQCDECLSGIVLLRDQEKRSFALGCNCEMGIQRIRGLKLASWNGEQTMFIRNRILEK